MYCPYFRGKQYELITVRECAGLFKESGFVPIIEPVQEPLGGLKRSLASVGDAGGSVVLVVNPFHGNHKEDSGAIESLLANDLKGATYLSVGIALREETTVASAKKMFERHRGRHHTFIHDGFTDAGALVQILGKDALSARHVFFEESCGKLYQKHFKGAQRILLRDGFQKRNANRHHPDLESFSDLHVTFRDEGMEGFGDFLVVGDDYTESGGPAYTVAIHLTFIDPRKDDQMFIHHFKSDRHDTPTDHAGKFREALSKLVAEVSRGNSCIARTSAVEEFLQLDARKHFPGLGYIKKLSMIHHIETLARYFKRAER